MTSDTAVARGRPRSEDRTNAILDATLELLDAEGYDSLRMQDVAECAGVGLATIYRRWEAKQDLVAAALECKVGPDIEPTGDVDTDLHAMLVWIAEEIGQKGEYIAGLMIAAHEHAVIATAIRDSVHENMRAAFSELILAKLGPVPSLDLIIDSIPGVLLFRAGLLDEAIDPEAFADEVMAQINAFS